MSVPEQKRWVSAVLYLTAVGLLLRFYDLPLKPLHHDEGVNAYFVSKLLSAPGNYRYDPANYHGPTLFYGAWASTVVFGVSTTALRVVTAAAGLATMLLALGVRRELGTVGALTAAALVAVSPGATYFSRYFIHEALLVCFTVGLVLAGAAWLRTGHRRDLLLAAAAAGMMTATKETAIITLAVLTIASLATLMLMGRGTARPAVTSHGWLLGLQVASVFLAVNLAFYTSFFTNWQGSIDALRTFAFWTRTGTRAHTHEWNAYFEWLGSQEFPLAALGLAGAAGALWMRDNRFAVFTGLWAIGTIAAYSLIPYKTPWLTLNMIAPLALSAGYLVERGWARYHDSSRRLLQALAVGALAFLAYQCVVLNFVRYDDERYPYVYAHTDRQVLDLLERIRHLQTMNPDLTLAVLSKDQFPLSWYLRDLRAGFHGKVAVTKDPLVIVSKEQEFLLEMLAGQRYRRLGTYRLRPGVQLTLYAEPNLKGIDGVPTGR